MTYLEITNTAKALYTANYKEAAMICEIADCIKAFGRCTIQFEKADGTCRTAHITEIWVQGRDLVGFKEVDEKVRSFKPSRLVGFQMQTIEMPPLHYVNFPPRQ